MTDLRDTIVCWVDQRIADMLAAPPMWGSPEAVELQVLQLLEMRVLVLRPEHEIAHPRSVLEAYRAYLRERFPEAPQQPLFEHLPAADEVYSGLAAELRGFIEALRQTMPEESPS